MFGLLGSRVALESQTHMGILAGVIHQKRSGKLFGDLVHLPVLVLGTGFLLHHQNPGEAKCNHSRLLSEGPSISLLGLV